MSFCTSVTLHISYLAVESNSRKKFRSTIQDTLQYVVQIPYYLANLAMAFDVRIIRIDTVQLL